MTKTLFTRVNQFTLSGLTDSSLLWIDIKADNFFVNWNQADKGITIEKVQLGDLEDAVYIPPGSSMLGKQAGNWMWRSPEAHARGRVNKPSDIFSFALVVSITTLFNFSLR